MKRTRAGVLRRLMLPMVLATAAAVLVVPPAQASERPARASEQSAPPGMRMPACGALPVVAHRGHSHGHTENTVRAFRSAVHSGAESVETDLRTSADGKLVLMHDSTLGRTTRERGRIHMLTGHEIHSARTNDGQRVPYGEAILRFLHNHERIVGIMEMKSLTRGSTIRLRRKIIDYGVMSRVIVTGRRTKDLRRAKRIMPHVRRQRLTWWPVRPRKTAHYADGVVIPLHRLDEGRVRRLQAAGLRVTAMASNRSRSRREMAEIGVDAVSSNNIPGFVEHCRTPVPIPKPYADNRRPPRGLGAAPPISDYTASRLGVTWVALTIPQYLAV
ncbi:MAG: glycerophosphodiester phosphodiesterase [Nocardioidaceae bacterium]